MVDRTLGAFDQTVDYGRGGRATVLNILDFQSIYFRAFLNGQNEVGPVQTNATGQGTFSLDKTRQHLDFNVSVTSLDLDHDQPNTPATDDDVHGFHFHRGAASVNGPVVWGAIGPDNDTDNDTVIDGPANRLVSEWDLGEGNAGATLASELANLLAGNIYLNIHTEQFPLGEIRGQLSKQDNGDDRIDVSPANIGDFATVLDITQDIEGGATLASRKNGQFYLLRLEGVAERLLKASDFIFAGAVNENIVGTALGDDLFAAGGNDTMDGGAGNDGLFGESGNDSLDGAGGKDTLNGGSGADTVVGGAGNDLLSGNTEADSLAGFTGGDRIFGAGGSDILNGGGGRDLMAGGTEADFFSFTSGAWGGDSVSDFQDNLDKLRFKKFIADTSADFTITGNGTTDVTLAIGTQTLVLHGAAPITLTNADFLFLN